MHLALRRKYTVLLFTLIAVVLWSRSPVLAQAPLQFEVATVKPAAPSTDGHTHINYPEGGAFSASNITLAALLQWAYDMPKNRILDAPPWFDATRFDLQAKADAETDKQLRTMSGDESGKAKRLMVQAMLAERFGMKLHEETRTLPAYDLEVAKGGAKLQPSKSSGKNIGTGRTHFNGSGLTMTLIAQQLSEITGRVVIDKTNLPDRYDIKLEWTPDDATAGDSSAPFFFTAIQEQLGLKLTPAKEPVRVIVIDQIQQASAN
jgi:uncharacterized protein (TIGR03435 family)